MKKKYNHAISVSFTLDSNDEFPKAEEMLKALKKVLAQIETSEEKESYFEVFDSAEN